MKIKLFVLLIVLGATSGCSTLTVDDEALLTTYAYGCQYGHTLEIKKAMSPIESDAIALECIDQAEEWLFGSDKERF